MAALRSVFGWVLAVLLVAAVAHTARADDPGSLTGCNEEMAEWRLEFDDLAEEGCFDLSLDGDELMASIACGSEMCRTEVPLVVASYKSILEECESVENFTVPVDHKKIMHLETAVLDMCNECTQKYAEMVKLMDSIVASKCLPTPLAYSCEEVCKTKVESYVAMWSELLEGGICHENMPGGCGIGGGLSEGAVYNELVAMRDKISVLETLPLVCEPTCFDAYSGWYKTWLRTANDGCVNFTGPEPIDLKAASGAAGLYLIDQITPKCTEHCMVDINDRIVRTFYVLPVNCRGGHVQQHFHQLRLSTGINACPQDVWHSSYGALLSFNMVGNVVIVLSIFFACVMALYCLAAAFKNYFLRGNRGLDILPNPFGWKRLLGYTYAPVPTAIPMGRRTPGADEEKLMGDLDA